MIQVKQYSGKIAPEMAMKNKSISPTRLKDLFLFNGWSEVIGCFLKVTQNNQIYLPLLVSKDLLEVKSVYLLAQEGVKLMSLCKSLNIQASETAMKIVAMVRKNAKDNFIML